MKLLYSPLSFLILLSWLISPIEESSTYAMVNSTNQLSDKLLDVLDHEDLSGTIIGLSVRNAKTGEVIFNYNGDKLLHPASSLKLVTAAAAFELLGADYRFETEVYTDGYIKNNVLNGNVYLRGKGDPSVQTKDLLSLASKLRIKGIKKIKGNIVADDSWYDHVRLSLDLPWSDETAYYGAQISALFFSPDSNYNPGTVQLNISSDGNKGNKPVISITPKTNEVMITNKAKLGPTNSKNTLQINRSHGNNHLTVSGNLPLQTEHKTYTIPVWEPTHMMLEQFQNALQTKGIKIKGEKIIGTIPTDATKLASDQSVTLAEIIIANLKHSNNTISEVLVKEIGRKYGDNGSWDKGLELIKGQYSSLGIHPDFILMRDGSGVSHVNLISTNALTSLLYQVQSKPWYGAYKKALPIAGNNNKSIGGTLTKRMNNTVAEGKVFAKTGTLSTVSSLTGFVINEQGNKYIFSVIINNAKNETNLKNLENEIAIILTNN